MDELHGRLLRILVESTKAKNVVEIGTGPGYSALWLCLGLKTTGGKLITHEIDNEKVLLARANFKRAGLGLAFFIPGCKNIWPLMSLPRPSWLINFCLKPWWASPQPSSRGWN